METARDPVLVPIASAGGFGLLRDCRRRGFGVSMSFCDRRTVTAHSRKARKTATLAASPDGYSTPTAGSGRAATPSDETPFSPGILESLVRILGSRQSADRCSEVKVKGQRQ